MRRAWVKAAAALSLAFATGSLAAQVAVPVRDTSATVARPDTSAKRADTTAAAVATRDTAATDTTAIVTAKHDSTVVITTRATPAKKGAKAAPEPCTEQMSSMSVC